MNNLRRRGCGRKGACTGGQRGEGMDGLKGFRQLMTEEDGMGTVEIILIIVVLVGLVILFKGQITKVVEDIFKKITTQTNKV